LESGKGITNHFPIALTSFSHHYGQPERGTQIISKNQGTDKKKQILIGPTVKGRKWKLEDGKHQRKKRLISIFK
jgi:hypothetical protein